MRTDEWKADGNVIDFSSPGAMSYESSQRFMFQLWQAQKISLIGNHLSKDYHKGEQGQRQALAKASMGNFHVDLTP